MIDAAECMEMSRQARAEAEEAAHFAAIATSVGKRSRYLRAGFALADAAEAFERAAEELRQVGLEP